MNVLKLLSFSQIKKDVIEEIVAKAIELGYDLEPEEVGIKKSEESGYWLIMPHVLHKWEIVYQDSIPVDRECATIPFMTLNVISSCISNISLSCRSYRSLQM